MTSYSTDGKVGPWAAEKLEVLRKYLHAYTTILSKQSGKIEAFYYIDAFSGAGRAEVRTSRERKLRGSDDITDLLGYTPDTDEEKQYLDGSPTVALDLEHPFTFYLFIDKSQKQLRDLKDIRQSHALKDRIRIREGDANEILEDSVINNPRIDWRRCRAVVFLDPFGLQVPWGTIDRLARTKAIEVIINFPVGTALQRLLQRDGRLSKKQEATLNEYLGTDEWKAVVYKETETLFGIETTKVENSGHKLALWYAQRLRDAFGFTAPPMLIRNSSRGHLYYLVFGGPNATGARIISDVLRQGEVITTAES